MYSTIFHVDVDAFFAAVEQADNPRLKARPVIIGAKPGTRGVVSACSYAARKFGIHSAMPISTAYRKCPQGVYLPVRMDRYLEVSDNIMQILQDYSPTFQQISVDEAFLDLTGTEQLFGPPLRIAGEMKAKVLTGMGVTISIGIAPNKYLAKLASEFKKPDGVWLVEPGREEEFLNQLKLKDLWGIGEKTLGRLSELNITTVPKLRQFPEKILCAMLGEATGVFLYQAVRGLNPGIHAEKPKSHTLSNEVTFNTDRNDQYFIDNTLLMLSHQVMFRLIKHKLHARTIQLKIRYHDFTTISHQKTLKHHVYSAEEIYETAKELFYGKWDNHTPVRLLGIGMANISAKPLHNQQELFEDQFDRKNKVEETVFRINKKLTGVKLTKASLLSHKQGPSPPEETEG